MESSQNPIEEGAAQLSKWLNSVKAIASQVRCLQREASTYLILDKRASSKPGAVFCDPTPSTLSETLSIRGDFAFFSAMTMKESNHALPDVARDEAHELTRQAITLSIIFSLVTADANWLISSLSSAEQSLPLMLSSLKEWKLLHFFGLPLESRFPCDALVIKALLLWYHTFVGNFTRSEALLSSMVSMKGEDVCDDEFRILVIHFNHLIASQEVRSIFVELQLWGGGKAGSRRAAFTICLLFFRLMAEAVLKPYTILHSFGASFRPDPTAAEPSCATNDPQADLWGKWNHLQHSSVAEQLGLLLQTSFMKSNCNNGLWPLPAAMLTTLFAPVVAHC